MGNLHPESAQESTGHRARRVDWTSAPLPQEMFLRTLCSERRRAERAGRRFILALLDLQGATKADDSGSESAKVAAAVTQSVRDTDVTGWYTARSILGVLFTEIGAAETNSALRALTARIKTALEAALGPDGADDVQVSFHVFPESDPGGRPGEHADLTLFPDIAQTLRAGKRARLLKRAMDITGSLLALILCSPLLFIITVLIKLTSPGPVLFRQTRLGQYGKRITFLKFRSMYSATNEAIHQEYMKRYIAGSSDCAQGCVYKLKDDPRITPLGRWLRRASLDEFPQFFNVLRGEMSLVGPRPPIPYEFEAYDEWHKRRLLVKPGITGPWQVRGRSRTTFDEMVRMDLRYAASWSPWGDLKLLFQTPLVVLLGRGAY